MTNRYRVEGEELGDRAGFAVVDTRAPVSVNPQAKRDAEYKALCECFEREDAELICKALNSLEEAN